MASWHVVDQGAPEFAAKVQARFEAGTNKTLATLRRDGAPRISATEMEVADGEVTVGMMASSVKLFDVRHDPRVAIQSPTLEPPSDDPTSWPGDAKLSGSLVEIPPPPAGAHPGAGYFRLDITEAALTYVGSPADHLVIESWDAVQGWRRRTRA